MSEEKKKEEFPKSLNIADFTKGKRDQIEEYFKENPGLAAIMEQCVITNMKLNQIITALNVIGTATGIIYPWQKKQTNIIKPSMNMKIPKKDS